MTIFFLGHFERVIYDSHMNKLTFHPYKNIYDFIEFIL